MAETDPTGGNHLSCSLASVVVRRVRAAGGEDAVARLLELARSPRDRAYLEDPANWISLDEAMALLDAAAEVTGDPRVARRVGEDAVRQHAGSAVATLLRSLGSPEEVLRQITHTATKFSTVTELEAIEVSAGGATVRAVARPGFTRYPQHCDWTQGLLTTPTMLFGLPPAHVEELECQARGGSQCLYRVTWDEADALRARDPEERITALESQLVAMTERLESVYATAADLIAESDLDSVLARITDRAATAVRAPRYLLAVRPPSGGVEVHQRGFGSLEADKLARDVLDRPDEEFPASWLVVPVRSSRNDYGVLVALYEGEGHFFARERELFELYARYAASALDRATALDEAQRRHAEADVLLQLARSLAAAGTTEELAGRVAEAVPAVVDCDRVSVFVWNEHEAALECRAVFGQGVREANWIRTLRICPSDTPTLAAMISTKDPAPVFVDPDGPDPFLGGVMRQLGSAALVAVPIVAQGTFLGVLIVSVVAEPERLSPSPELLDRLSGVVAQAATALQNGRLVDRITHQAHHDSLTGVANRLLFVERVEEAIARARADRRPMGLLFVDLDGFKAVNDRHGHSAGDELLCRVAARLLDTVRAGDTVARLGGDEFAVVLAGAATPQDIDAAASRVLAAFDEPFEVADDTLKVQASVGRAAWPRDAAEIEPLLRAADAEMYRVKQARA